VIYGQSGDWIDRRCRKAFADVGPPVQAASSRGGLPSYNAKAAYARERWKGPIPSLEIGVDVGPNLVTPGHVPLGSVAGSLLAVVIILILWGSPGDNRAWPGTAARSTTVRKSTAPRSVSVGGATCHATATVAGNCHPTGPERSDSP
jgi:hypothetical protein